MFASIAKFLRWFFGNSEQQQSQGVRVTYTAGYPPSDLDKITEIVRRDGPLTPAEYDELKRSFAKLNAKHRAVVRLAATAPFPDTAHKPPRKRAGKAKRISKRKRKAA